MKPGELVVTIHPVSAGGIVARVVPPDTLCVLVRKGEFMTNTRFRWYEVLAGDSVVTLPAWCLRSVEGNDR